MTKRENFGSRAAVIMAMAGSAIGLGNIWRFPYIAGEYGGSAFIIIYICCTVLVSLPVFIAEISLGRKSRKSSYGAMASLAPKKRKIWRFAGWLSVFIPLFITSYYSVIGGWSLDYLFRSFQFVTTPPDEVSAIFGTFISSTWMPLASHLLFLAMTLTVVALGVKSGIEFFSKITIPALFILMIVIMVYSISLPGAAGGVEYMIKPDFSKVSAKTFAYALGQSFYSMSLGMGAVITYGSYIKHNENLVVTGIGTAISDLLFAILAGLAIMPAVFAAGIKPGAGPGLIFQSVPYIFSSIGTELPILSTAIAALFFLAIVVAAMSSCISMMEVGVSYMKEKYNIPRVRASIILFVLCGGLGILCSLSFGPLSDIQVSGKNIFDMFDWLSSNVLLLLLSMITVIFVGFALNKQDVWDEITNKGQKRFNVKVFNVLYFLIKWVAPVSIALIFITNFIL